MTEHADWPALPYADWAPTKKTLHMVSQMLGKVKLALAPPQPQWFHVRLFMDPRGFATGPIPHGARTVSLGIDVFQGAVWLAASDGRAASVPLAPDRTVADIWADVQQALGDVGLELDIWQKPQELADVTPFSENTHDGAFVAANAQRYHRVLSSVSAVYEEFRSPFFGRSGVQFWWGSFDLAVLLFNGRATPAPTRPRLHHALRPRRRAPQRRLLVGDDTVPTPGFFAYLVPRPPGCEAAAVPPTYAGWVEEMGEWMMSYEDVRTCSDPRQAILDFLGGVYDVATSLGGWDAAAHVYTGRRRRQRG